MLIVFFVCACLLQTLSGEIHRANANKNAKYQHSSRSLNRNAHRKQLLNETSEEEILYWGHPQVTWVCSLASAALVGLSGIFPLAVIPIETGEALRKGAGAAHLKLLLSFAVGGLLGDVFLHLLPEAWQNIPPGSHGHSWVGLWVLVGLLTFLVIEKIFPDNNDEDEEEEKEVVGEGQEEEEEEILGEDDSGYSDSENPDRCLKKDKELKALKKENKRSPTPKETHIKTTGWLNLMANIIDNFTHGLAVAGSYCVSTKTGVLTTIAVLLHEVPHEVGDFAILLKAGFDRWRAAKAQLLTASGGLLGAMAALCAESAKSAGESTAWVLPFTSGGFIYIAMVTILPDLLREKNLWRSIQQTCLLLAGIAIMMAVTLLVE